MFAIEIEGEFLDLFPDDSFEISRINRMFDKQTSGLYSELPLRVPKTQKNRRVFQFFDSLDNAGYRRSYPAILHVDEMERQGVVKVMSSDDRGFEFYFLGDGSYFFSKAKTKITEFPYFEKFSGGKSQPQENIEVVDETFLSDIGSYTKRYPSANFVFFPMYNPAIKEPPESLDLVSYVNNWDPHGMKFWADQSYRLAAFVIGFSFAIKQVPWLIGPYMAIWLYKESSDIDAFRRYARDTIGVGLIGFMLPNIPFAVSAPLDWIQGVLTPVAGGSPLTMQGAALVSFTTSNILYVPRWYFVGLVMIVYTATILLFFLWFDECKWAAWILPAVVYFVHYRSLLNYFVFAPIIAYYALILKYELTATCDLSPWVSIIRERISV